MAFSVNGEEKALIELPLLGLVSDQPNDIFFKKWENMSTALRNAGWKQDTMISLEFVGACGAIGHIKISDEGLLDVDRRRIVDTIVR
jgi:adenine deaminase